ncbi:MAG TPA: hypothetical protein VM597_25885 [Gemmataceae bacterium]|nr:hypothetical protein [Gemmataceae bacterium]
MPAADADFPVRVTRRLRRALRGHLVNAQPYRGPCLRVFLAGPDDPRVEICDAADLTAAPHVQSRFGATTVGVPETDAAGLAGCVLDRRSFPPGEPALIVHQPAATPDDIERPGRITLALPKLAAVHPELSTPASAFTKVARAVLSVTSVFAQTDGNPGWLGRLVGEDDPDGQAEAIEAVARTLWDMLAEPAVLVSTDPPVAAAYLAGFDHVVLLRVPEADGQAVGDRLISCNAYGTAAADQPDLRHGPRSYRVRNTVWPVLADPLTDDADRLRRLKAEVAPADWGRVRRLGEERLAAGDRPRDGRPWLSRIAAADQGKGWWRRKGGYLR